MRPPRSPQRCLLLPACALVALALTPGCASPEPESESESRRHSPVSAVSPATLASAPSAPRDEVLDLAWNAYACGRAQGAIRRPVLGVIDYSLPSNQPRFWLIDAGSGHVRRSELVSHGQGSGDLRATRFSNTPGSNHSSLGLFVTGETYTGRHGLSLRLHGLEPGSNDAAYERAIVMHGAWYATEAHAARFGRLGRSLGCPALAPDVAPEVLDALAEGAALFVYGDDADWLADQPYARCSAAIQSRRSSRSPSRRARPGHDGSR